MSDVFLEKSAVRKEIKDKVKNFCGHLSKKLEAEKVICQKVLSSEEYKKAPLLLAYWALGDEADLSAVISRALADGKKVALPVVQGEIMNFYLMDSQQVLEEGAFGIKEPAPIKENLIEKEMLCENTLILVPGRAFTTDGKRLGRGKGYYDKWFSSIGSKIKNLTKWGICFPCQLVDNLPADEKDVPMDYVCCR